MRTLVVTDLHLNSRVPGLLDHQVHCILNIFNKEKPDEVIIMGDVFMYRKPSPSELLAFRDLIGGMPGDLKHPGHWTPITILRGNHDSETKADDGVTALSLFERPSNLTKVITHTHIDHGRKRVFIPHYENEETIINALEMVPEGYTVFGHFGYAGCLNSIGDYDSSISLSHFSAPTLLGHIHSFREGQGGLPDAHSRVVCLGTPYTTNYGEAFKNNYYAILEREKEDYRDAEYEVALFKKVDTGPRHLVYAAKDIEDNLETINDPAYFTFLRVMVGADHHPIPYDKLNVAYVDVKYSPIFNEEEVSTFTSDRDLFSVNEMIISDYVEAANSTISSEDLMKGYRLLKDED